MKKLLPIILFPFIFLIATPLYGSSITSESRIYGVTVDDVSPLNDVVKAVADLPVKMTVRIVFDEYVNPDYYRDAVERIGKVAYLQGEILDSAYMKEYSVQDYIDRTNSYLDAFGDRVDIWEIGNEVNGIWLMESNTAAETKKVVAKLKGAYSAVKKRGYRAGITLYYNGIYNNGQGHATDNCWEVPGEHMLTWARANIPADMRNGLDYVWISYYEQDCLGYQPNWQQVMEETGALFPNAKIGIGECGSKDSDEKATGKEKEFIKRYYVDLAVNHPRYVGGQFWWYFNRDMVPKTKPLWDYFNNVLASTSGEEAVFTNTNTNSDPAPSVGKSKTCFVSQICMYQGRVSLDQPLEVLNTKDQKASQDDWKVYRQFFEGALGRLTAVITFTMPEDAQELKFSKATLCTNFMSSDYDNQKWLFMVKNVKTRKWVTIGNNKKVPFWQWSDLEFSLPGDPQQYLNSRNQVKIKLISPANDHRETSQIDYLVIRFDP